MWHLARITACLFVHSPSVRSPAFINSRHSDRSSSQVDCSLKRYKFHIGHDLTFLPKPMGVSESTGSRALACSCSRVCPREYV